MAGPPGSARNRSIVIPGLRRNLRECARHKPVRCPCRPPGDIRSHPGTRHPAGRGGAAGTCGDAAISPMLRPGPPQPGKAAPAQPAGLGAVHGGRAAVSPAQRAAQQRVPGRQGQHTAHRIPPRSGQKCQVQHPGQASRRPVKRDPGQHAGELAAPAATGDAASTAAAPVTGSPPPARAGWAPHRRRPAAGPGPGAGTPVTTTPRRGRAGRRPRRCRTRHRRRCSRRRAAADAA